MHTMKVVQETTMCLPTPLLFLPVCTLYLCGLMWWASTNRVWVWRVVNQPQGGVCILSALLLPCLPARGRGIQEGLWLLQKIVVLLTTACSLPGIFTPLPRSKGAQCSVLQELCEFWHSLNSVCAAHHTQSYCTRPGTPVIPGASFAFIREQKG